MLDVPVDPRVGDDDNGPASGALPLPVGDQVIGSLQEPKCCRGVYGWCGKFVALAICGVVDRYHDYPPVIKPVIP